VRSVEDPPIRVAKPAEKKAQPHRPVRDVGRAQQQAALTEITCG
jgi:hypothetical protein